MSEIQSIQVSTHGAELQSLIANGREYLWQGDPAFWSRRAPILFPIVGRLADDTLRIGGKAYTMKQHGFARDAEFVPLSFTASFSCLGGWSLLPGQESIFMKMDSSKLIANYPYDFDLKVRYAIFGNTLEVNWEVKNSGDNTMYFQIGAHPAFLLPYYDANAAVHGYLRCYNKDGHTVLPVVTHRLENGLRKPLPQPSPLGHHSSNALIPITNSTFANDAILLEGCNIASIALVDMSGKEVLRVSCSQAETFGLWAPNKPGCPFVCIEPWCGIADKEGFNGNIIERDCIHSLVAGKIYEFNYSIIIADKA